MEFHEMVSVVKKAVAAGVEREAEVFVDLGHGPLLRIDRIWATGASQLTILVAPARKKKSRRSPLPGQRTMFGIWDKGHKVKA